MRASLIAHLVKNLPAMQETLVRFLGWKDPLEKGKAVHSSIFLPREYIGASEQNPTSVLGMHSMKLN